MTNQEALRRKADYVARVTRGEGWMPWQARDRTSEEERAFREKVERRKAEMLSSGVRVLHPVLLTEREIDQARKNIRRTDWAKRWFEGHRRIADHVVAQGDDYVERMLPEETPWTGYTFACPNCIGVKSQEGAEYTIIGWDHRRPDEMTCKCCGQVYPSEKYPETARLVCPRSGQVFTFYLNDAERRHPKDRSGRYAYHWAHHPIHVSFSGIIRERKIVFMLDAVRSLALVHRLTKNPRYAALAVRILARLTHCYPRWLYHDYWDTVADCDPLYAAWHDKALPLEWKRNLFTSAYEKDAPDRAAMLQTFWGAGRIRPVFGWLNTLPGICEAYDLTCDARGEDGRPIWTRDLRDRVERDLILEWIIEAEPFVGGRGKAENVTNKAPFIYHAQAAVAKCLGIPELADVALRGYQAIRDRSFGYDGFCHESPSYNAMYLNQLVKLPEMLHGFRWPKGLKGRKGTVNLYRTDARLRLMFRAEVDQIRPDGRYLPLSDTHQTSGAGGSPVLEVGLRRFPEYVEEKLSAIHQYRRCDFTEYAVMRLDAEKVAKKRGAAQPLSLPEVYFPNWMTAILRHGAGRAGTVLCLASNPPGGHRHYDNLTLFYADRGQTILGDQGYLAEAPIQRWVKSTFSHN
ncbi:heparinase II/III family protein, partial [bacterium]|nr:heparinase II/III family protein [bacterium]